MQDQRKYRKGNTCRRLPNGDNHYKDDEHKQHSSGILTDGNANTRLTHSHSHSHCEWVALTLTCILFTCHSTCGCICGTICKAETYTYVYMRHKKLPHYVKCFVCPLWKWICQRPWISSWQQYVPVELAPQPRITRISFAFLLANRAQIKPGSGTWPEALESAIAG